MFFHYYCPKFFCFLLSSQFIALDLIRSHRPANIGNFSQSNLSLYDTALVSAPLFAATFYILVNLSISSLLYEDLFMAA